MCPPLLAGVLAVRLINEALLQADPQKTLAALLLPAAALPGVTAAAARRYHHVLTRARVLKAQVGLGASGHRGGGTRRAMWRKNHSGGGSPAC